MLNTGINSVTWKEQGITDTLRVNYFSSRMSYVHQLFIARKINRNISLQIAPTVYHQNLVEKTAEPNDLYYIGLGGSFKLTRSTRFNIEWYNALNKYAPNKNTNMLSFCFDIETGGHVFQLVLSNTQGMVENQFLSGKGTTGNWQKGDIYLGFNLLRFFAL